MSIVQTVDALQAILDRLRTDAIFNTAATNYHAGALFMADQTELIIARRLEVLDRWIPQQSGATRRHELMQLRDAIRRITPSTSQ